MGTIVEGNLETFLEWLVDNLEYVALVQLARQAKDAYDTLPLEGNATPLEASLEAFLVSIENHPDLHGCDHEAGLCNCALQNAVEGETWITPPDCQTHQWQNTERGKECAQCGASYPDNRLE